MTSLKDDVMTSTHYDFMASLKDDSMTSEKDIVVTSLKNDVMRSFGSRLRDVISELGTSMITVPERA